MAISKDKSAARPLFEDSAESVEAIPLSERKTDELVIAFVGPIASGVSYTASILKQKFEADFGYSANILKISNLINDSAKFTGEQKVASNDPARVDKLQTIGNRLRERFGTEYFADKCVEAISLQRGNPTKPPESRRHVTIIDSVKNPDEVMQLRDVYGETFWLIGVFAPEMVRKQRLLSEGHDSPYIEKIFQRDQDEGLPFGQRVRATMQLSDFFIRNDRSNDARLANTITRFLEILFGVVIHIPTIDESSMNAASAAAGGSACLSRQVGAVVVTEAGDLIGRGVNDVPKFGGGLYTAANGDDDHRCFKWKSKIFHNDDRKNRLSESLVMALRGTEAIKKGSESNVRDVIQKSEVKNLIEFSRAVHAEMEAILSVARGAKPGLVGSTLYCTTFPCHSCARLIVASGIHKVVYIEAYIKSLAIDLHETRSRWMKSRSERRLSSCSTRVLLPAI